MTRCASVLRRPAAGLAGLALAAVLAGCGLFGPEPEDDVLLEQGTTEVELAVGASAQVSLGEGSQGVGDEWGVVAGTDEAVATAEVVRDEEVHGAGDGEDAPGSRIPFAVEVTGVAPGTTTVRVLYCTRTEIAEGCDQSKGTLDPPVEPVEITVTVR